jgi:hypothetical protein
MSFAVNFLTTKTRNLRSTKFYFFVFSFFRAFVVNEYFDVEFALQISDHKKGW